MWTKKSEMCWPFLDRVDELHVADYRNFTPQEMWLKLIQARLQNDHYRSDNQLISDVKKIAWASVNYNGEDDEISLVAQNLTTTLVKELKSNLTKIIRKPSGKTTPKLPVGSAKKSSPVKAISPEKVESRMKAKVVIGDKSNSAMSFGFGLDASNEDSPSKDFVEPMAIGNGSSSIKKHL